MNRFFGVLGFLGAGPVVCVSVLGAPGLDFETWVATMLSGTNHAVRELALTLATRHPPDEDLSGGDPAKS
jgi:hypothetical protein